MKKYIFYSLNDLCDLVNPTWLHGNQTRQWKNEERTDFQTYKEKTWHQVSHGYSDEYPFTQPPGNSTILLCTGGQVGLSQKEIFSGNPSPARHLGTGNCFLRFLSALRTFAHGLQEGLSCFPSLTWGSQRLEALGSLSLIHIRSGLHLLLTHSIKASSAPHRLIEGFIKYYIYRFGYLILVFIHYM